MSPAEICIVAAYRDRCDEDGGAIPDPHTAIAEIADYQGWPWYRVHTVLSHAGVGFKEAGTYLGWKGGR